MPEVTNFPTLKRHTRAPVMPHVLDDGDDGVELLLTTMLADGSVVDSSCAMTNAEAVEIGNAILKAATGGA